MLEESHCFVEWKEQYVSQERGNRVVHYILKDSAGDSVLTIVGTERSVRHMFYVVAEEFVRPYGAAIGIHSGHKWRSRREVVDWLTSMISKPCGMCIVLIMIYSFPYRVARVWVEMLLYNRPSNCGEKLKFL